MRKAFLALTVLSGFIQPALAQSQMRKLPSVINHPSLNVVAPYISADGNALLFASDGGQDGALIISYTSRERDWSSPIELPKHLNNRLNFLKGYALTGDGKKVFVTSAKSPVIGGYDIMSSDLSGNTWSMPVNLMLPINSKSNEACPSITPDGNVLYFMRCDNMDQYKASGCKIFSSTKKSNGQWSDPVELPASVNTGNSQTPRILADGETLIFSSDKIIPNKGGMDLYMSKLSGQIWSEPVALDFVNTERDDQYVTVSANGRYIIKEAKGARNNYELTEFLFPDNLRPRSLMKVEGKILGADGGSVASYIAVTDLRTNKPVYARKTAQDGSYFFYLPEGSRYEMSVDPEQSKYTFYSKYIDLESDKIPQKEKINVTIKTPQPGDEIPLNLVAFDSNSTDLNQLARQELGRLSRLVKANPDLSFEIQVTMEGLKSDSIRSSPDLTEMKIDSVIVEGDSTSYTIAKTTYHNDRTLQQAEAINNFLNKEGILPDQLSFVVNAIESTEPPKVSTKAVVR